MDWDIDRTRVTLSQYLLSKTQTCTRLIGFTPTERDIDGTRFS